MNQRIKIGNLTVECFVNEYDKVTRTQKQINCPEISSTNRAAINRGLDSTDFGEYFRVETDTKIVTGIFNVVDTTQDE
jgi:hypothetical protein